MNMKLAEILKKYGSAVVLPRTLRDYRCPKCGQPVCAECGRCCNVSCRGCTCDHIEVVTEIVEGNHEKH